MSARKLLVLRSVINRSGVEHVLHVLDVTETHPYPHRMKNCEASQSKSAEPKFGPYVPDLANDVYICHTSGRNRRRDPGAAGNLGKPSQARIQSCIVPAQNLRLHSPPRPRSLLRHLQCLGTNSPPCSPPRKEIRIHQDAMDRASKHGHINVLYWWLSSGLELKYTEKALDQASKFGHMDVLRWWKASGLGLKRSFRAVDYALNTDVLTWWSNNVSKLTSTSRAMEYASEKGRLDVLEWWLKSGWELKYTERAVDYASANGHITVLEWWKSCGLRMMLSHRAIDLACRNGHVEVGVVEVYRKVSTQFMCSHFRMRKRTRRRGGVVGQNLFGLKIFSPSSGQRV